MITNKQGKILNAAGYQQASRDQVFSPEGFWIESSELAWEHFLLSLKVPKASGPLVIVSGDGTCGISRATAGGDVAVLIEQGLPARPIGEIVNRFDELGPGSVVLVFKTSKSAEVVRDMISEAAQEIRDNERFDQGWTTHELVTRLVERQQTGRLRETGWIRVANLWFPPDTRFWDLAQACRQQELWDQDEEEAFKKVNL